MKRNPRLVPAAVGRNRVRVEPSDHHRHPARVRRLERRVHHVVRRARTREVARDVEPRDAGERRRRAVAERRKRRRDARDRRSRLRGPTEGQLRLHVARRDAALAGELRPRLRRLRRHRDERRRRHPADVRRRSRRRVARAELLERGEERRVERGAARARASRRHARGVHHGTHAEVDANDEVARRAGVIGDALERHLRKTKTRRLRERPLDVLALVRLLADPRVVELRRRVPRHGHPGAPEVFRPPPRRALVDQRDALARASPRAPSRRGAPPRATRRGRTRARKRPPRPRARTRAPPSEAPGVWNPGPTRACRSARRTAPGARPRRGGGGGAT